MVVNTLLVCIFGAPGSGKSTAAAGVFSKLKADGFCCELVREYAKDLCWQGRGDELTKDQPYVTAVQAHREQVLLGKTEVVVTDSPAVLGCYYGRGGNMPNLLNDYYLKRHQSLRTLDLYVRRGKAYNTSGRVTTEEEANAMSVCMYDWMESNGISLLDVGIKENHTNAIVQLVLGALRGK